MKLANARIDGEVRAVLAHADHVIDISGIRSANVPQLLRAGRLAEASSLRGMAYDLEDIEFEPPIDAASRILCVGFNFKSHAQEADRDAPAKPNFFVRFPSSLVGHHHPISLPVQSTYLDWEGEIAVIIGRAGRAIHPDDALAHIAGYTCFGDHSVRDFQMHGQQATAGKNFDATGSIGPWITTTDEAPDPLALSFETRLNGDVVQTGVLSDLIHDIPAVIAYASSFMRLEPGDVIALGTPPGIGARRTPPVWLKPNDLIEIVSPQLGTLSNRVVAAKA